ncbi:hypothetical protein IW148_001089 [Coemansia sp. RSA 1199]|nr:hypothetical protein IW148_001089 [Coemansia sp. RSA 1199]
MFAILTVAKRAAPIAASSVRALTRVSAVRTYSSRILPTAAGASGGHSKLTVSSDACRELQTSATLHSIIPYKLADIGEGITECEIIQWYVKPGDKVSQFDKICEVASDKATVEITSRYDGVIRKLHYQDNDIALVGKPIVDIEIDNPDTQSAEPAADSGAELTSNPAQSLPSNDTEPTVELADSVPKNFAVDRTSDVVYATPAVRRVARENNVDLHYVAGSGKGGRILKEDVLRFIELQKSSTAPGVTADLQKSSTAPVDKIREPNTVDQPFVQANASSTAPGISLSSASAVITGEDQLVSLSPIQRAMFKSMTDSLGIPHFRFKDEIELDALIQARQRINKYLAEQNGEVTKMTYMPFFVKAASLALTKYPILNARVVAEAGAPPKLQFRASHNIGVAMDTPGGLIVPNIKNVQTKSLMDIAAELGALAQRGRSGAIGSADLRGGTFTLSNVGMIGGTYLSPVLVDSEVCIGAIGKVQRLPRFETVEIDSRPVERVVPRHILVTSWSADHRVVDGATMARFAVLYKKLLEHPEIMLANMK